ncbi:unnamed protein product [Lymnaea stagnalis]|uniref:Beta-1,3-galactosyl-O-glycosyl-glycoprotein beta-1,6-N-acetylglucosaminyltransferase n=1 Tax=Lymnaea stagnalis TaxID=6523 RepID=A0AAV2HLU7_LYMST
MQTDQILSCTKKRLFVWLSVALGLTIMLLSYGNLNYNMSLPHFMTNQFAKDTGVKTNGKTSEPMSRENATYDGVTARYLEELSRFYAVQEADCSRLFSGDKNYTEEVVQMVPTLNESLSDEYYMNLTEDCEAFRRTRGYVMSSLTDEEREFPIAFSIVAFKNSEMVERLLRAIYRPQNYYCIHVDVKASNGFLRAISAVAQCFPNVFLPLNRLKVTWGTFSVLESELSCMRELGRYKKWKYFINLTGQEFPLKTNFELVKILKSYNGANNIEGVLKRANQYRWKNKPPPFGLRPVKGSVHITASRFFIDYILHNDTAEAVLNWTRTILIPDEAYFSTLNYNPELGIRGTYNGNPDGMYAFLTRFKIWSPYKPWCPGHAVRWVCIQSTPDLPRLGQAKHLFANKFYLEEDRVVIGCLEEKLSNDTRDEYMGIKAFNDTYYRNLIFVKNQIL